MILMNQYRPPQRVSNPSRPSHASINGVLTKSSILGVQKRFIKAMELFCAGVSIQVEDASLNKVNTLDEMLATRRLSVGGIIFFAMVEYAYELRIPDYVFEHPVIKELELLSVDITTLTNDIFSYPREEEDPVPPNLVASARLGGLGPQEAFSHIGEMVHSRYRRWEEAVSEVPKWGDEIDRDVAKYIKGILSFSIGNLYWSFESKRYFGDRGPEIRKTRCLSVRRSPAFLQKL
ncbi:isoprenoid synthase domain-containing protein [Xylaria nigripes]|nr:isoprenoid synthase domain-containing protein [Xylaria nigripes]